MRTNRYDFRPVRFSYGTYPVAFADIADMERVSVR